jgi:hypothetical protein
MPIFRVWVTTHIERRLYVDAEDERTAEAATWAYLNDSTAFWPALPAPWEYSDAEDYIDADGWRPRDEMAPGDVRAVATENGDVGWESVAETAVTDHEAPTLG